MNYFSYTNSEKNEEVRRFKFWAMSRKSVSFPLLLLFFYPLVSRTFGFLPTFSVNFVFLFDHGNYYQTHFSNDSNGLILLAILSINVESATISPSSTLGSGSGYEIHLKGGARQLYPTIYLLASVQLLLRMTISVLVVMYSLDYRSQWREPKLRLTYHKCSLFPLRMFAKAFLSDSCKKIIDIILLGIFRTCCLPRKRYLMYLLAV